MDMIVWLLSISTCAICFSSAIMLLSCLSLSIVSDTATSLVQIMSMGVLYRSKISNTALRKPYARSILSLLILMAVMPSLAATAFMPSPVLRFAMIVPGASGCMVFFRRTGMFLLFAGRMQVGWRIL